MDSISILLVLFLMISIFFNVFLLKDKNKLNLLISKNQLTTKDVLIDNISNFKKYERNLQEQLNQLKINQLSEINELKEKHRNELKSEFEEGFKKGINISKIEVRVTPIKRIKKEGNFGFKKEVLEIGYSYRLFSNDLPCLDPHDEIIEKIEIKEINEKFVELLNEKFNQIIERIPNSNFVITESIEAFTSKLLKK